MNLHQLNQYVTITIYAYLAISSVISLWGLSRETTFKINFGPVFGDATNALIYSIHIAGNVLLLALIRCIV